MRVAGKLQRLMGAAMVAALSAASPALAEGLRMGIATELTALDPHFQNATNNLAFSTMIFDTLTQADPDARIVPGLAESWKALDDGSGWEFHLRDGVKFHDGSPLTAEDVAFSLARVPTVENSPSPMTTYVQSIDRVEVVDPLTLRILTKGRDPLLPVALAQVAILSHTASADADTAAMNGGKGLVGTGPYRADDVRFGGNIRLTRNDDYWGGRPAWDWVDYRQITNDAARTAALLSGDVDMADQVPSSDVEMLRKRDGIAVSDKMSLRLMYLALDQLNSPSAFVTDNDGKPLDPNPLRDIRVRRALGLALDRDALVSRVMEDMAAPAQQLMPEGTIGYLPDRSGGKADIDAAKALLAEAGYPDGFRITLHSPNDRFPNDAKLAQAIGQLWSRAGIRTAVEVSPWANYISRASKQEFSAFLVSIGNSSGEPSSALRSILATYDKDRGLGSANRSRYSNPEFDKVLAEAMQDMQDGPRVEHLQQATVIALDDAAFIPLVHLRDVWAMRKGIDHVARNDGRTRAQDFAPAP